MTTLELKLTLPDKLAREATAIGLTTPQAITALIRAEVRRRQQVDRLFAAADHLAALDIPPLTTEEVEAEIHAASADRDAVRAGSR